MTKEKLMYYDYFDSARGRMLLVSSECGLAGVYFVGQKHYPKPSNPSFPECAIRCIALRRC